VNTIPEAIENYAVKFNVDKPMVYPTDKALRQALQHCALPPRVKWLPEIRLAVLRLRTEEHATRMQNR
jgi:hypothetical protein